MELFYHNNLYLVSIYYIGEIETISMNFSLNKIYKRNWGHLPGQYTAPSHGSARLHVMATDPCAQQRELLLYGLSSWPFSTTPAWFTLCSLPGLHLPFKNFLRDPNSNQNTALWKVSCLHFLWNLAQNSPETGEYRICLSVLVEQVTCCLRAKPSAPCSVLNGAEIAGA